MTGFLPEGIDGQTAALLAAIALVAGLARGFSGFGAALIFMPMASSLVPPALAAGILVAVDFVLTLPMIPDAWKKAQRSQVTLLCLGAIAGVPAGTWILKHNDPMTLRWIITLTAGAALVLLMSGWRYRGAPRPWITGIVGAVSGLFSGIAQIGGPPVVAYLLGGAQRHEATRANIILFFAFTGALSAITYFVSGLVSSHTLYLSLLAGPAYGAGLLAGSRLFGLASELIFRRLCFLLIAIAVLTSLPVWH